MHRQTIDCYDAGAERWRATRRATADTREWPEIRAAHAFRAAIGEGVIVDLGCGSGAALAALGEPVVGLDASMGMLGLVDRDATSAPLVAGDLEALPLAAGAVDGAFASFSFQHLPREQFVTALVEVNRVLRPGGRVELWMHASDGVDGVREGDDMGVGRWFTYWSSEELVAVIPKANLELITVEDHGFARRTVAQLSVQDPGKR